MAGITMCSSINCPVREICYRSRAETGEIQSWSNFEYVCNENNGFADFIPITPKKNENIIKVGC